jgi:para-nitrobenzyl esterase
MSTNRRTFIAQSGVLLAGLSAGRAGFAAELAPEYVTATTAAGAVRGVVDRGVRVFKGIPYGGSTAGSNRFMPPTRPAAWTGTRDALAWGASAPQTLAADPALDGKRPVMVWLHGGGWSTGSGSGRITDGTNLARTGDVVLVSINHRLNVFGFTTLAQTMGAEFAPAGAAGLLDIVAALQWVRDNIGRFGGDPNLVTIFGQSGGGRKVATLMSMPAAKGLFHRAIIESGAVLRLSEPAQAQRHTAQLLTELGLRAGQVRELQKVPMPQLLAANTKALQQWAVREPGWTPNSPAPDGRLVPGHPFDPGAPALSADIPLLIGWARTEESFWERPTPERNALDAAGLQQRVEQRLNATATSYEGSGVTMAGRRAKYLDPAPVIETFRRDYPQASPFELYLLIASEHPRGVYTRELARRKAQLRAAPAYLYRFDWETPEGGGMRSPHTIEVQFAFNNIALGGPLISQRQDAHALAARVSAAWVAFARSGNPAVASLPAWPAYSAARRDTMLFNTDSRVVQDPGRDSRVVMERVLELT